MIWQSKLLNKFHEISHGFVSDPYSFPFYFSLKHIPSYIRFLSLIKIFPNRWVVAEQVHGDNIYVSKISNVSFFPKIANKTDIILTQERRHPLIMFFADCIPIFVYIPKIRLIGLAHSGWRGTIKKLPQKLIYELKNRYNISSEDIFIGVGPSIHSCCFEVKEDFISQLPKEYRKYLIYEKEKVKYDLIALLLQQLEEEKIPKENVDISDICTYCNNAYYSYRRNKTSERNIAYIFLK
uniref:Laccase domain-containing protein n=1 Tax=Dictyoglomus thermophilum TaxID=14 RepID=A0A7C3MKN9_DICTH